MPTAQDHGILHRLLHYGARSEHASSVSEPFQTFTSYFIIVGALVGLYLTANVNYLVFHTLAEVFSIVIGFSIFVYMGFDFRRRIRLLKKPARGRIWNASTGGAFDLATMATGIELAMVGFIANCMFYGLFYFHWFWTLIGLVWILTSVTDGPPPPPRTRAPRSSPPAGPVGAKPGSPTAGAPPSASLGSGLTRTAARDQGRQPT